MLNFREDSMSPLALILIGQPSLRNQLKVRHLEAIDQRIQMRYQIQGFTEEEQEPIFSTTLRFPGQSRRFIQRRRSPPYTSLVTG